MNTIKPALLPAYNAFRRAASLSRAWDSLVSKSITLYGPRQGSHISGIYSDHFPPDVQARLRKLATAVSAASDKAWGLRPKRVRNHTMRGLRLAVIARYGSGFYG